MPGCMPYVKHFVNHGVEGSNLGLDSEKDRWYYQPGWNLVPSSGIQFLIDSVEVFFDVMGVPVIREAYKG